MSQPALLSLPSTILPVFNAENRWAALYVSMAPAVSMENEMISLLCGDADPAVHAIGNLPRVIEVDLAAVPAGGFNVPAAAPLCLLLSAADLAADEAQQHLAPFLACGVKLMVSESVSKSLPDTLVNAATSLVSAGDVALSNDIRPLLRKWPGPHLATDIGTSAVHRQCLDAGYHWFSGDWMLHPDNGDGSHTATSRSTLLNLLGLLASDADSHEIELLLKRDLNLPYQLLKLVNSVSFSLTQKINSFSQAITLLGRRQLQRWLQLLLYAGHHSNGSINPLLGVAALRAALMEALAEASGGNQHDKERGYMVGMFSLLDVLFNAPLDLLIKPLNLDDDIARALVDHEGKLGQLLEIALASGAPADAALAQRLSAAAISPAAFLAAQLRAHAWAAQICRDF